MTRTLLHIDAAACAHHDGYSEEACRRTVAALTGLPGDYRTGLVRRRALVAAPIPVEQVPEAVRGLVARGLAKNPAERPANAEQFVQELEVVAGAVYGPDWEERGRRELAALAALLLSGRTSPASTTDFAQTMLPQPSAGGRLRP
ncbi:hypothetical protein HEP87_01085 [Streptomyces sp. S1D4-11]